MPTISIVIPIYLLDDNIVKHAKDCIDSIRKYTNSFELIIINNGGVIKDDYFEKAANIYVLNETNIGYGPAINQGFKLAKGKFLCAMNDDVEVREDWTKILRAFADPQCAVVRPGEDRETGQGVVVDHTWYHGFCWVMKRELWQSLKDKDGNLLDEQFRIGNFEDLSLWQTILERNLKLYKDFDTRVYHYGGLTIKKLDHEAQNNLNEQLFIKKHNLPEWREIYYPR